MTDKLTPVPEGYHTVTPWIIGKDTAGLIDFLTAAFGGEELARVTDDHGNIGHAEVRIGDSVVMLFDKPQWPPTPSFLRLYVADDAEVLGRAVQLGARVVTEPTELFWGDRVSRFQDPYGNLWWIHQRVAELSEPEMTARLNDPRLAANMEYVQSADFRPRL